MLRFLLTMMTLTTSPAIAGDSDVKAHWAELAAHQRLSANFTQVQHRSILSMPIESTGRLAFARPGKLLWRVDSPATSIFVMSAGRIGMAYPDLGVRQEVDLSKDPDAMRLVEAMMVWMDGDYERVTADYDLTWTPAVDGTASAVMTPTNDKLKPLIARIELTITAAPDRRVASVSVVEPDDDRVDITLIDVEIDPELSAATFELPDGGTSD